MKLLVDTHLLIWSAQSIDKLPRTAVPLLGDTANSLMFSVVSIWEIVIKARLKPKEFSYGARDIRRRLLDSGYHELAVSAEHVLAVADLPDHHRDPFDRLLVAQARVEALVLVTADKIVGEYPGAHFVI